MASAGKTSIVEGTRGVHDYEPDTRRSDSRTRDAGRVDGSIHHAVRRTLVRASGGWKEDSPQVREVDRVAPAPRQPAAELVTGAQLRRVRRVARFARLEQAQVERLLLPSPLQTGSSEDRPAGPALLRLAAHRCEPVCWLWDAAGPGGCSTMPLRHSHHLQGSPRVLPRRLRLRYGTARFLDKPLFSTASDPAHHVSAPKRRLAQFRLMTLPQQH